jgi:hypothetical protein
MFGIWTIVYREGDFVGAVPAESRESAHIAARLMIERGRAILAIRDGETAMDVAEIERLIGRDSTRKSTR